jgi:hypothetical protein
LWFFLFPFDSCKLDYNQVPMLSKVGDRIPLVLALVHQF